MLPHPAKVTSQNPSLATVTWRECTPIYDIKSYESYMSLQRPHVGPLQVTAQHQLQQKMFGERTPTSILKLHELYRREVNGILMEDNFQSLNATNTRSNWAQDVGAGWNMSNENGIDRGNRGNQL